VGVRRLFWFSVGAASAVWVTRRGEAALREVQERGVLNTLDLIAGKTARLMDQIDSMTRPKRANPDASSAGTDMTEVTDGLR
jgi:hypothetical protein